MEEPTLQSDIAPTIIDLDSPDGQEDLSDQNHTEAQMIDESKEKEKEREKENSPQMIDLDPSGQDLLPDFQKDPCLSPQSKNDNENEANRDSDMRNVRSERKSNTAHSPHRQHDEGESMGKERPDSTKEITGSNKPDMWGQDTTNNNDRRVRRSSDSWGQQPVDRVHKSNERGQPVDRVHRSGDSPNERRPHRSHRNRSRSRSWSRSPSGPRRTDWRSPVDRRAPAPPPAWENNRRPPVGPQPCRDFMAGRCRRGPQCRFGHSRERERDGRDRERERERHPVRGEREFKEEVFEMRGQSEYSRQQGRKGNFEEGGYGYDGRERERCFDFTRGRCKRGADCRFVHDEPAGSNVRERDERESNRDRDRDRDERESYRGGGSNYDEREGANRESDLSYEREREGRRGKKEEICKFFLEGRCGRGTSCRFSHDVAHQVHEDENDMNESSWSSQRESGPRNNQYIVPVTETQNQYNTPLPVPVPVPPVVNNPYMGVNPNPNPNLQGYNNIQSIPVPNLNQMTQPSLPPPPVNPPLPPPPPGKPPNANPNPSNLMTSEQAANITDFSAFVSQILATNNSTVPVPVPVPEPAQSDLHESPITPPVETETLEMKKEDGSKPNPNPNLKGGKESKGLKLFKCALVEVVKDLLKPTWKDGQLSREVHKTIVKKVVDKVVGTVENLPQSQEKIDVYLSHSKPKLMKLVQAYVEKYVKA